jgi:hypothetical protein
MSWRIRPKVCPRQPPSSVIFWSINSEAAGPSVESDFFMFVSFSIGGLISARASPFRDFALLPF